MKVKQVRVAQALRGETSNLLESTKYDMVFDKGMLDVRLKKNNEKGIGPFKVFPANIAWMEYEEVTESAPANDLPAGNETPVDAKRPGRQAKK